MSVNRTSESEAPTGPNAKGGPENCLRKASRAEDPAARAKYATSGLSAAELESDTQLLLLRQLCLSHMERGRHHDAREIALQMVALGEWPEIAHQEAARVSAALGDFAEALNHLRVAGRAAPASRRGFHLLCLGSTLYALGRYSEASEALGRATRWATQHKALASALQALCGHALGRRTDLAAAYTALAEQESSPGVADWVGAELLLSLGQKEQAVRLLRSFVSRLASQPARAAGLRAELERANRLLAASPESAS